MVEGEVARLDAAAVGKLHRHAHTVHRLDGSAVGILCRGVERAVEAVAVGPYHGHQAAGIGARVARLHGGLVGNLGAVGRVHRVEEVAILEHVVAVACAHVGIARLVLLALGLGAGIGVAVEAHTIHLVVVDVLVARQAQGHGRLGAVDGGTVDGVERVVGLDLLGGEGLVVVARRCLVHIDRHGRAIEVVDPCVGLDAVPQVAHVVGVAAGVQVLARGGRELVPYLQLAKVDLAVGAARGHHKVGAVVAGVKHIGSHRVVLVVVLYLVGIALVAVLGKRANGGDAHLLILALGVGPVAVELHAGVGLSQVVPGDVYIGAV